MSPLLGTLADLAEDMDAMPSTHRVAQVSLLQHIQGTQHLFLPLCVPVCAWRTHKPLTHMHVDTKKINLKSK